MLKGFLREEKGFTLLETMVVLIIVAVLIGGGIKYYTGYIDKSKITKAKGDITVMQAGLDSYYMEKNQYPTKEAEFIEAGLSEELIAINDGSKAYYYSVDDDFKTYTIRTTAAIDNNENYVSGTGTEGRSSPPVVEPVEPAE